jgi:hypothetical protein
MGGPKHSLSRWPAVSDPTRKGAGVCGCWPTSWWNWGVVERVSHETVRQTLKKNRLKPWQVKQWCIPRADAAFVAAMEDVLDVYERPYNAKEPVVCFDESSKQLLQVCDS